MIPILFDNYETAFTSNGLGRLADCLSCTVTEERNGIYECQFQYPVIGEMFSEIQEGRIIGVIHDDNKDIQPFDIYARTTPLNGVVTFYARHISYRLRNVILKPFTASSCAAALDAMTTNSYNTNPFSFWTDKAVSSNFKVEVPSGCKSVLMGQEGSVLDVYGTGEYEWDKWTVKLHTHRGADNGVSIRYGVNLLDLTQNIDDSDSYSAVAPFWRSIEGDQVVTLPEGIIIANSTQVRKRVWTTQNGDEMTTGEGEVLEFNAPHIVPVPMDLSSDFETAPTVEQLRTRATQRLNNSEAWLPSDNLSVKFIDLAHTEDYKNVAALQRVSLCDYVNVYCGPVGVSAVTMKVIKVVYNVLEELYDEIEIGSPKASLSDVILAQVNEKFDEFEAKTVSVDTLGNAIANATERITGAQGGHLLDIYDANGKRQEMLIMDTEDVGTAAKVWRFNLGGMGYSRNGYDGPYTLAITQDGAIVADFITAGTLTANVIKAGRLASVANTANFWDMTSGEFVLKSIGATNGIHYQNGVLVIDASAITVGTLDGEDVTIINLDAGNIVTGTLDGENVTITNLDASNIITGTLNGEDVNIINLNADNITAGTLDGENVNIINLNADNITAGTISDKRGQTTWDLFTGEFQTSDQFEIEADSIVTYYDQKASLDSSSIVFSWSTSTTGHRSPTKVGEIGTGYGIMAMYDTRTTGEAAIIAGAGNKRGEIRIKANSSTQSTIWLHSTRIQVGTSDDADEYYGVAGPTTFRTADGKTVTVRNGIITKIV